MSNIDDVKTWLQNLQNRICAELETIDGEAVFAKDAWERSAGGGGISRVLSEGEVFEQAGVGFSHVYGDQMPPSATKSRPELAGKRFQAVGVSLVLHPRNPYVPTTHANFRFFSAGEKKPGGWFGGGSILPARPNQAPARRIPLPRQRPHPAPRPTQPAAHATATGAVGRQMGLKTTATGGAGPGPGPARSGRMRVQSG